MERGTYLDVGIIGSRVAPALDSVHCPGELALASDVVGPYVAVALHAGISGIGLISANVQRGRAVHALLKGGGDPSELHNPVAPLGADDGFAVTVGDAAENIFHESLVANRVGNGGRRTGAGGGVGRARRMVMVVESIVLLLKIDKPLRDCRRLNPIGDFHTSSWDVAEEIPPLGLIGEGRVSDPGDEAGHFEEVIDLGEISVGEGVAREAAQDATRGKSAGRQDRLGDFAGRSVVTKEDDALLRQHGIYKDDDRVCVGARGGQMGVQHKGLGVFGVRDREHLDELDEREVTNSLRRDCGGDLDGDRNGIVDDAGLEFVGVAGGIVQCWSAGFGRRGGIVHFDELLLLAFFRHTLLDHPLELFDEHVFRIGRLQDVTFESAKTGHEGEVHGVDRVIEIFECFGIRRAEVFLEGKKKEGL